MYLVKYITINRSTRLTIVKDGSDHYFYKGCPSVPTFQGKITEGWSVLLLFFLVFRLTLNKKKLFCYINMSIPKFLQTVEYKVLVIQYAVQVIR